jgi:hypothetical protein
LKTRLIVFFLTASQCFLVGCNPRNTPQRRESQDPFPTEQQPFPTPNRNDRGGDIERNGEGNRNRDFDSDRNRDTERDRNGNRDDDTNRDRENDRERERGGEDTRKKSGARGSGTSKVHVNAYNMTLLPKYHLSGS